MFSYLHSDDGVDEEEHGDQQDDVGQGLEGLDERPEQDPDRVALAQQLDQAGRAEQAEKTHVDEVFLERKMLLPKNTSSENVFARM